MLNPYLPTAMVAIMILAGCTTVQLAGANAGEVHHFLGYTRLELPKRGSHGPQAIDTSVLGVYLGEHAGVGYRHQTRLALPDECRLVVFVAVADKDATLSLLSKLFPRGDLPCLATRPN